MRISERSVLLLALGVMLSVEAVGQPGASTLTLKLPPAVRAAKSVGGSHQVSNACRNDEFFIDVKEGWATPPEGFQAKLETLLPDALQNVLTNPALPEPLIVDVEPVFGQRRIQGSRGGSCLAHDGHLRFFRVRFAATGTIAESVLPGQVCAVVDAIRGAVGQALLQVSASTENAVCEGGCCCRGKPNLTKLTPRTRENLCFEDPKLVAWQQPALTADAFNIGRSCPAAPLDAGWEAEKRGVDGRLLDWHLHRIGAPARRAQMQIVDRNARASLVLIDSGVRLGQTGITRHTESRAWHEPAIVFPDAPEARPVHGELMTRLAQAVGTRANLYSVRVIDDEGNASIADVARAVESALFDNIPSPRVINLSLGWPPEWEHPRPITGQSQDQDRCESREDPVGEAAKFAIALAHHDPRRGETSLVLAAAGNRGSDSIDSDLENRYPLAGSSDLQGDIRILKNGTRTRATLGCGAVDCYGITEASPQTGSMFYPGQWSVTSTDTSLNPWTGNQHQNEPIVFAPGAVDHRDKRVVTTRPPAPRPLELPGQSVYVRPPEGEPVGEPRIYVNDGSSWNPYDLSLPEPVTGTSVSTVLLSAIAAEAQALWRQSHGGASLSNSNLLRLIYWSGTAISPPTLGDSSDLPTSRRPSLCHIESWLRSKDCRKLLDGRLDGDEEGPWRSEPVPAACKVERCSKNIVPADVHLPTEYVKDLTPSLTPSTLTANFVPCSLKDSSCLGGPDLGIVGPQPDPAGCPSCQIDLQENQAILILEFTDLYDTNSVFTNPHLTLTTPDGKLIYSLKSKAEPYKWHPGQSVKVLVDTGKTKGVIAAELSTEVVTGAETIADVSPLLILK